MLFKHLNSDCACTLVCTCFSDGR